MAKKSIFTVGFELPGEEFEYIPFRSDRTLLDADIILFEPSFGTVSFGDSFQGKSTLSQHDSFRVKEQQLHWTGEIADAVKAGKLVIVYLVKPVEYYRYTGRETYSGTGRNQRTTHTVEIISSYDAIQNFSKATAKSGKEIRLEPNAAFFSSYWKEFSKDSPYEVELEGKFSQILLRSHAGNRTVGAAIHAGGGSILFLPPLGYDADKFTKYNEKTKEEHWTKEAVSFGKRLAAVLVGMFGILKHSSHITPPPSWSQEAAYRLAVESELENSIGKCNEKIVELRKKKEDLDERLRASGRLRGLLFEQGHPLELIILEALRCFGFEAEQFANGESEFDAVFVCPEGRCIGEAEGKDNKPINIDKFSQLERNINEDFCRDEVQECAKGVLFGNAYRLAPLAERKEFFTEKCLSAAYRTRAALVRTPDLFAPTKYLKENPDDSEYAKLCRDAIMLTKGAVVVFPQPPGSSDVSVIAKGAKQNV